MTEQAYFSLPTKAREAGLISPEAHAIPSSPSWRSPKLLARRSSSSLQNDYFNKHSTPPSLTNSPTPQLTSTFSDIQISPTNKPQNGLSSAKAGSFRLDRYGMPSKVPGDANLSTVSKAEAQRHVSVIQQVSPLELFRILTPDTSEYVLLIDMRSASQFKASRIGAAINISIPPILLKRPVYTIQKIAATLGPSDQKRLLEWKQMHHIIIYDADTFNIGPGSTIHGFATKFLTSDGMPKITIIRGGFNAVMRDAERLVDQKQVSAEEHLPSGPCNPIDTLGGISCASPGGKGPANPFYNNIRQNQDLIGGVGEPIALQLPKGAESVREKLPFWLRELAFANDGPRKVADKFLKIEQEELKRMQHALNAGSRLERNADERHSVAAGVERGDKNRYNNIWPFENARVRLRGNSEKGGEYINASHLHVEESNRHYIATQGPLPRTTKDFWQMIWENQIRTIVMLTRTMEGGQAKCHTYWDDADMSRPFEVENLAETELQIGSQPDSNAAPLIIRSFSITNVEEPLADPLKVTHIQFLEWPDLHVVQPEAILAVVKQAHEAEAEETAPAYKRRKSIGSQHVPAPNQHPILSHCSAGCGRTGVFCTVDTVIDLVKAQLDQTTSNPEDFNVDLVEKTVRGFRDQRLSMVQTLRQFVLCYDAVLLFCVRYLGGK